MLVLDLINKPKTVVSFTIAEMKDKDTYTGFIVVVCEPSIALPFGLHLRKGRWLNT